MNRIQPVGSVQSYRTFQIVAPTSTHRRPATCAEVECPNYLKGWRVRTDTLDEKMLHAAKTAGRKFTELHVSEYENWIVFEAGQPCFRAHQHSVPLNKQEIFISRDGDFRGNPTGNVRKHTRPEFWVEEMSENLGHVRAAQKRG